VDDYSYNENQNIYNRSIYFLQLQKTLIFNLLAQYTMPFLDAKSLRFTPQKTYLCMNFEKKEMSENKSNYSANNIQALEGLEAVRMRPGMYIGTTDVKGLHHLVWEVVDNSIDEHLAGHCKSIQMIIHEDNSISVTDDGRGIPTGMHEKLQKSALEVVMTVLHAGGKFDKDTYKVSGGLHGVGVSCVNALSTKLVATVHRDGKIWQQEYSEGIPQTEVTVIGDTDITGTVITFHPDPSIFDTLVYNYGTLASRMKELSYLNSGLKLKLTDERVKEDGEFKTEDFYSEGGLKEFVKYLDESRTPIISEPIHVIGKEENVEVEVAMQYNTGYQENIFSFVNNISTREGGTHVALPLRGKILNVEKAMEHKIYENEEIKNMFTALGVSIEEKDGERILNIEKLRYHKIVIMCDADVDGSHIATLILTFFYRYMTPLVEQGYIYIAAPPLYQVKKGKSSVYCWNEEERIAAIKTYSKGENDSSVKIQRYKGLGEMNAEQLWETTMDPEERMLRQIVIEDDIEADRVFSMLMGDEVPPRRKFIEENATYANIDI